MVRSSPGKDTALDKTSSKNHAPRRYERRRAPRYPFDAPLEMEWGSALLRGRVRDISAEGMFIELAEPLWVGAGFAARLELDEPVKLHCSVRRVEAGRGMGVSVAVPEEEGRLRYRSLLRALLGRQE